MFTTTHKHLPAPKNRHKKTSRILARSQNPGCFLWSWLLLDACLFYPQVLTDFDGIVGHVVHLLQLCHGDAVSAGNIEEGISFYH